MNRDSPSKELFEFIRTIDNKSIPSIKTILGSYNIETISIEGLFDSLKNLLENVLIIDARSEKEFNESSLHYSKNFPVLNNSERHNVGLIYKKYSQSSALWLAIHYADPKTYELEKFLKANHADKKKIYVYCWRGGGRSGYLSKMISDIGYKPIVLKGGHKSFRRSVTEFFSQKIFPFELLELSGLTGTGKSELLQSVSKDLPVIDLEYSAKHYSSLLGHIPYEIRNFKPVQNQSAFENDIYSQIYFSSAKVLSNQQNQPLQPAYIIESESKRVGDFEIPKNLFEKLNLAPSVKIISTFENRVKRIVRDYFCDDLRGIEPMKKIFSKKENFFRQQLSNKIYDELIVMLNENKVNEFTTVMMEEYYDKKYKDKGKKHIAEISTDNMTEAKKELTEIYLKKYDSNFKESFFQ
ncbi:MAG: tRNA 2-selenouridine(34) synthase MnmH [Ignavibacteria bacterium]